MLNNLRKIAYDAGEILLKGYREKKDISFKGTVDLVTTYDVKIEQFIKNRLEKEFKDFNIIGEESGADSKDKEYSIYIDPIDGTTNFVHNIPHVGISMGIWRKNDPIAGVVYNPILDEMFYAKIGKGAYCNNQKIVVSDTTDFQQSLMATGFPYTKVEKGEDFHWVLRTMEKILPYTRDIRRLGAASLDLCYCAKGVFDAYYELGLKPWDVAAGIVILLGAGGSVSNEKGSKYNFNDKIILATNGKIHHKLVNKIQ